MTGCAESNSSAQIARGRFWLLLLKMSKIEEVFSGQSGTVFLDGRRETPPANERGSQRRVAAHVCTQPLTNEQKEDSHAENHCLQHHLTGWVSHRARQRCLGDVPNDGQSLRLL